MKSFLTGSRRYGTPREDSDTDLVVLVSQGDLAELVERADKLDGSAGARDSMSLRFGPLNLIAHTDVRRFETWLSATLECVSRSPVTRDEAIETVRRHYTDRGITP